MFAPYLESALTLLDVGCGNGRQSFALAEHFPRVMGVDLSAEAIRGARALYERDNLEFRVVDILDDDEVAHLHDELGDANVNVRGVLHQLRAEDLAAAVRMIATLVGWRGKAFVVELSPSAEGLFKSLASDPSGPLPSSHACSSTASCRWRWPRPRFGSCSWRRGWRLCSPVPL